MTAYVSADGAYGGPVAVALDQAAALTDLGHTVTVAAGWDGLEPPAGPARLRLFRARKPLRSSFVGLFAPGLLLWVARHAQEFDVVHVHVTRDLVTLPAAAIARRRGVPVVLQPHGQIRAGRSRAQGLVDRVLGARVLRGSAAVLALTPQEDRDLRDLGVPADRVHRLENAVPPAPEHARPADQGALVLYSSRLAERKRPRAFVAAAEIVSRDRPDARFEIWGADAGERAATLDDIERRGLTGRCVYRGATTVERSRARLADAAVLVLPSRAEPFPMALLEAFAAGLPAVITEETGLSRLARETGAAVVTDGSPARLAEGILRLLDDPDLWLRTARSARALADVRFSPDRIAGRLTDIYQRVVAGGRRS